MFGTCNLCDNDPFSRFHITIFLIILVTASLPCFTIYVCMLDVSCVGYAHLMHRVPVLYETSLMVHDISNFSIGLGHNKDCFSFVYNNDNIVLVSTLSHLICCHWFLAERVRWRVRHVCTRDERLYARWTCVYERWTPVCEMNACMWDERVYMRDERLYVRWTCMYVRWTCV